MHLADTDAFRCGLGLRNRSFRAIIRLPPTHFLSWLAEKWPIPVWLLVPIVLIKANNELPGLRMLRHSLPLEERASDPNVQGIFDTAMNWKTAMLRRP